MADGVTALRMLSQLLWDDESGADPGEVTHWASLKDEPGASRLLAAGAGSRMRGVRAVQCPVGRGPWCRRGAGWRPAASSGGCQRPFIARELWPLGADTAFDQRIGGDRELAFTSCALRDLKRIEHAAGQTV